MVPILMSPTACKRIKNRNQALVLTGILFFFLHFAYSACADERCGQLVETKCIDCHFETRICQKLQKKKGKSSWKRTIKSMVRHGTTLNRDEQKKLVQCFAGRDSTILDLCKLTK